MVVQMWIINPIHCFFAKKLTNCYNNDTVSVKARFQSISFFALELNLFHFLNQE